MTKTKKAGLVDRVLRTASKKGTKDDPTSQIVLNRIPLTPQEAKTLYEQFWAARNVVDILAEDLTRGWIEFTGESPTEIEEIEAELKRLNAQSVFHDLCRHEAIAGDALAVIGLRDGDLPDSPASLGEVISIDFLHVIGREKIADIELEDDVLAPGYGKPKFFVLKVGNEKRRVHESRVLHLQTRSLVGEVWGSSVFTPLTQLFTAMDNAEWSVGQILFSLIFKVFRSKSITYSQAQNESLDEELSRELNALSTAVLGPGEELEFKSPSTGIGGAGALLEYLFQTYAAATRIPKTRLIGQQAGTLTGAEFDVRVYYDRIRGIQEAYLRELIQRLISYIRPDAAVTFQFKRLLEEDKVREADRLQKQAAALLALTEGNVISIEEARGMLGLEPVSGPLFELLSRGS